MTGFVDEQTRDYLCAVDVGVQLRISPFSGPGPLSDLSAFTCGCQRRLMQGRRRPEYVTPVPETASPCRSLRRSKHVSTIRGRWMLVKRHGRPILRRCLQPATCNNFWTWCGVPDERGFVRCAGAHVFIASAGESARTHSGSAHDPSTVGTTYPLLELVRHRCRHLNRPARRSTRLGGAGRWMDGNSGTAGRRPHVSSR